MNLPAVSIVMRSYNEGWALKGTLEGLKRQAFKDWELIVIDSGSTDNSHELIRAANPRHFVVIKPHEYHPPRVLNMGMRLASANRVIFLNADATPLGQHWLAPLAQVLNQPEVAAVYGRQVPRPGCHAVYSADYENCFGKHRVAGKWDHFFSMVSSGIRKDVWARRGFNEAMQYSEDEEYTRWCVAQGYRVLYVPESVAMHSHNYTAVQAAKRAFGEGRAHAAMWGGDPARFNFFRTVLLGTANDARRDLVFCLRNGRLKEWPHALRIRWHQRNARLEGFRSGWQEFRAADGAIAPPMWSRWGSPAATPPAA